MPTPLTALQWAFWIIGIGLQILLVISLSQGARREFPALYAYVLCLLVTTATDILAYRLFGKVSPSYRTYYWLAELVRQSTLFAVVVSLALHIIPMSRRNETIARMLVTTGFLLWIASVWLLYSTDLNSWMTSVVRNLSFFTAVLNLLVWFACISAKERDIRHLMIAGGLGLQMTGDAIGQAVRQLNISNQVSLAGSIFIVVTHLLCLYIWWRALTPEDHGFQSPRL